MRLSHAAHISRIPPPPLVSSQLRSPSLCTSASKRRRRGETSLVILSDTSLWKWWSPRASPHGAVARGRSPRRSCKSRRGNLEDAARECVCGETRKKWTHCLNLKSDWLCTYEHKQIAALRHRGWRYHTRLAAPKALLGSSVTQLPKEEISSPAPRDERALQRGMKAAGLGVD